MSEINERQDDMIPIHAEKVIMYQNFANRRMLIALISVCVTLIISIFIFVSNYTSREKNWMDLLERITRTSVVTEEINGMQQDENN